MKRILYTEQEPNLLISHQEFFSNNKNYRIVLDLKNMIYNIFESTQDEPVIKGKAFNYNDLKKLAKKRLKNLGVEFATETRNRRNN